MHPVVQKIGALSAHFERSKKHDNVKNLFYIKRL